MSKNKNLKRLLSLKEDPVLKKAYNISQSLGVDTFLVGGLFRNLFLSLPIGQDYDLVLIPGPARNKGYMANIAERIAQDFNGSFFPLDIENSVYRVVFNANSIRFPLTRGYTEDSPISIDLSPIRGKDIETDLSLRDFTMNAIALDLKNLFTGINVDVVDPLEGRKDLQKGLIRSPSEEAFVEDPVRLLRGVRFSAVYGLKIEEKTRRYIKKYSYILKNASGERIRDELFSILGVETACPYVEDLSALGLIEDVLPYTGDKLITGTFLTLGETDVLLSSISDIAPSFASELTGYFEENIGGVSKGSLLKFTAMIHDTAGYLSDRDIDKRIIVEKMATEAGKGLKLSNKARNLLRNQTKYFPAAINLLTSVRLADFDIYRFFREIGRDGISPLILALSSIRAEDAARRKIEEAVPRMDRILTYLFEVFYRFSSSPLLTGSEIMETFDIHQGKMIGDILKMLEEARARSIVNNREEAVKYIRESLVT